MSWVTAIWAALIGACGALALPHFLVGLWQRRGAHLCFAMAAASVIAIAAAELAMMRTRSIDEFVWAQRWAHLPVFFLVVSMVGFVHLYFTTGRLWLGIAACAVRFVSLVINFLSPVSLNFREITALRQLPFLGETVTVPVGAFNPWTHLGELSSALVLLFVIDASIKLWRNGKEENRRRALIVGGGIVIFILAAAGLSALINRQVINAPYLISFPFAAILVAMAVDLGLDLYRSTLVAQKLRVSEASLRESEGRFRTMADAAPVLIWMSGPDKLCTFFNQAWLDFTGRTMEQETGNGWAEGVHSADLEECHATYVNSFDARKPFIMQYRLRYRDGTYRSVTDHGVPRSDSAGNFLGYIGGCVDVTDLLEKEQALREFEERVTLAAKAARLGVWELNTANNEMWMSDSARALFQFDREIPVTHAMLQDRLHTEDRASRETIVNKAITTRGSYETEYRICLNDGTIRWIGGRAHMVRDTSGQLTRLLGVSMDVTERKQAQELFRLSTEASPSGILLVNDLGNVILVNTHIEDLFGYDRDDLIGKRVEILLPEGIIPDHAPLRTGSLATPEKRSMGQSRELFARRKNGTEFPVEIGLNPIQTPEGILVLATVVDISARKLAEEQGRRRREKMSRLSRLSLLGEMTASIAHEVNQPLSGIISNASAGQRFIDRGDVDPEKLREILGDIVADGRRAHDVVHNIRNTIKRGTTLRKRIDLNEVVLDVTRMIQPDAQAHFCELRTSLARDLPVLDGDPIQIQQLLINLLSNAFDAMRETAIQRRKIDIATEQGDQNRIRLSVRDHGSGIAETSRDRLFEQFFTTKEEGLGMGLAIVHSIVEAHAGTIAAENVADGGARFDCTFPVSHQT